MAEDRLKLAVFVDFDNIQIGVKDTLGKDFDVSLVLEALKERGEVVSKIAYGDWNRAGDQSRQMAQYAVQMVQRNLTPRGDKNGADINLALDALEMAFTRHHINAFAIVGGDSDFITLVEKLKQYDKRVFVVGGRQFTSHILQRNCNEFIAYENLLRSSASSGPPRPARSAPAASRVSAESRPLSAALPNVQRTLKILADREVSPQVGLLKSTLLQLDPTFSERDYGAGSFLEFMQKMQAARLVNLRKTDRGYLVELAETEGEGRPRAIKVSHKAEVPLQVTDGTTAEGILPLPAPATGGSSEEAMSLLKQAVASAIEKTPNRALYVRQVRQMLRSLDKSFDEHRYGFRGILDLLHRAQRDGLVRLHRDRKGAWRVFDVSSAPATEPAVSESVPQTAPNALAESAVPATDVVSEQVAQVEEVSVPAMLTPEIPPSVTEEATAPQTASGRKARKARASGVTRRRGQRRTSARQKSKEPSGE